MLLDLENQNWLFELEDKDNKDFFWIRNIYGPTNQGSKEYFWNTLEDQRHVKMHLPCIIVGGFNVIISTEEIRGGSKF